MKKLLFTLLISLCLLPCVNADSIILQSTNNNLENHNYKVISTQTFEEAYNSLLDIYKENTYKYYAIYYVDSQEIQSNSMRLVLFNDSLYTITVDSDSVLLSIDDEDAITYMYTYATDNLFDSIGENTDLRFFKYNTISLIDTNFQFALQGATYEIQGFYADSIYLKNGDILPTYLNLKKYSSWSEYSGANSTFKEVNLDDYEYVILNLKDYTSKSAFETNLKVKGSIAITPVYEFGTVEKEVITDRCNTSYSDYTDYRFFILKNDLINNAVYIVKECAESGSSFKFDSSIFNVTYVTVENVNDPVITVGGAQHHTIPFNKLSNTVNKNEEENFIPGSTEQFNPLDSLSDHISSFWNLLTTLMGLVTKFFNTLPVEIRAISITMFTTAITLGVIKFIKS